MFSFDRKTAVTLLTAALALPGVVRASGSTHRFADGSTNSVPTRTAWKSLSSVELSVLKAEERLNNIESVYQAILKENPEPSGALSMSEHSQLVEGFRNRVDWIKRSVNDSASDLTLPERQEYEVHLLESALKEYEGNLIVYRDFPSDFNHLIRRVEEISPEEAQLRVIQARLQSANKAYSDGDVVTVRNAMQEARELLTDDTVFSTKAILGGGAAVAGAIGANAYRNRDRGFIIK